MVYKKIKKTYLRLEIYYSSDIESNIVSLSTTAYLQPK